MGQIWNRITRIARATFNDVAPPTVAAERIIRSDDDELRRIIEELSNSKAEARQEQETPPPKRPNGMTIATATIVLGVPPDAAPATITAAYRKKILQIHPDRVIGQSPEIQDAARLKTVELNAAYQFLKEQKGF